MSSTESIQDRAKDLLTDGATSVDPSFNIAIHDQADIIYGKHRILLTLNDEDYKVYADVMQRADLPYVVSDVSDNDEVVVAGSLPRDARAIPRIMMGRQPIEGLSSVNIFAALGQSVGRIIERTNLIPVAVDVSLQRTLVLRDKAEIMWLPPMHFIEANEETVTALTDKINTELFPKYVRFGAVALLNAFEQGMRHDNR